MTNEERFVWAWQRMLLDGWRIVAVGDRYRLLRLVYPRPRRGGLVRSGH